MITKVDFNGIGQVANHPDLAKLDIAINEAVTFDLPELFLGFWETIRQIDHELNTKQATEIDHYDLKYNLVNGGKYINCNNNQKTHLGTKKTLAYYAYARYSVLNSFNDTPVGNVARSGDFSLPKPLKELEQFADKYRNMGYVSAQKTLDFICHNKAVFLGAENLCKPCDCSQIDGKIKTKGYGISGAIVEKRISFNGKLKVES